MANDDTPGADREQYDTYDWTLDILVSFVAGMDEHTGPQMGLTLTVGGTLISGTLCSMGAWLDAIAEIPVSSSDAEPVMDAIVDSWRETLPEMAAARAANPSRREFLHMRNARVHMGSTNHNVGAIRVRLSEVTAWAFGEYLEAGE